MTIIGIAGGTGSGKTTVMVEKIKETLIQHPASMTHSMCTKEEIEAVEDECRRGIELQAKEALKTSGDKLTEDEVMNLVYASREERP